MRNSVSLDSFMFTANILIFCSLGVANLVYVLCLMPAAGADYLHPLYLGSKIGVSLIAVLGLLAIWGNGSLMLAPPFSRYLLYRTAGEEFDEWCAWHGEDPRNRELLTPYLERKRREQRQALVENIRSASWKDITAPVVRILVRCLRDSLFLLGAAYFFFFVYLVVTCSPEDFSRPHISAAEARSLALWAWAIALIISALVSMGAHRAPALLYRFLRNSRAKKDKENGKLPCLLVLLLSAALVTASGCAGKHGPGGSFVGDLPEAVAVETIAADASGQLAALYPPGHTRLFVLTPEKGASNGFSLAFENALRQSGFTVLASPAENAVAVAYVLDRLNGKKDGENAWYLQLRISDNEDGGIAFARSYTATGTPEAGRSKTDIAFSRSLASRLADKAARKAGKAYNSSVEYLTE